MQYYIDRMADYGLCGVVATDGPVAASGPLQLFHTTRSEMTIKINILYF
jgi:hypothetical protein